MNILILISSFKNLEVLNIYYLLLPYFWMTIWFFSFSSSFILLSLPKPFRSSVWNANGPPTGGFLWRSGKVWSLSTTKSRRWGYEWGYYWDPFKWPKISWGNWGFILSSPFWKMCVFCFCFFCFAHFCEGGDGVEFFGFGYGGNLSEPGMMEWNKTLVAWSPFFYRPFQGMIWDGFSLRGYQNPLTQGILENSFQ